MLNAIPSNAFDHHLRAAQALATSGQLAQAAAACRQALELQPADPTAHFLLGYVLQQSNKHAEATEAFAQSAAYAPTVALPLVHLGNAFLALGRMDDARGAFERALAIDPRQLEALTGMGLALVRLGRAADALEPLRRVVALAPGLSAGHTNLGLALSEAQQPGAALEAFEAAVRLTPDNTNALANLGLAYMGGHRYRAAAEVFKHATQVQPANGTAWGNLLGAYTALGLTAEAIDAARRGMAADPGSAALHSALLMLLHYADDVTAEDVFREHLAWAAAHGRVPVGGVTARAAEGRALRVGYVSPDFRKHPVAQFVLPLLAAHHRERVEVTCYSLTTMEDEVTRRVRSLPVRWRSLAAFSDAQAAAEIRAEGIDILVDLAGHTAGNRLAIFAYKPAPVQVTWLGYPDTTGLGTVDFRMTDAVADPAGAEALHTETLWRLPGGFLCYEPSADAPAVGELAARERGFVTFGSFNAPAKLSPACVRLWAALLGAVPGSRLLLKAGAFADAEMRGRVAAAFAAQGVAAERIEFRGYAESAAEHLATYNDVDIALDTFPYNGTTTTCDALWMGAPVLTLCGQTHAARVGASLLAAVGMKGWAAETAADFVRIGCAWAADLEGLAAVRAGLRGRMAAVTDREAFATRVEEAFAGMWAARVGGGG
jgi:predicted O-linked N-acetylglucosamine transferase (SPINDLY family)